MARGVPVAGDLSDLELAIICDRFHVLPSQVMAESAYWMRRVLTLLHERDEQQARKGKGKDKPKR